MKKLWRWLRTLDAGEWIALVVFLGASAFVLALVAANIWSVVVGSLQPEMAKVKGTDYDLIAQRSMSAAAWWMVWITGVSALVGGFGLYLIARTLQEAKRSADAADQAVEASHRAIETAREMGQAQVKAYLIVEDASITYDDADEYVLRFTYSNSGQTPATKIYIDIGLYVEQRGVSMEIAEGLSVARHDLAAGSSDTVTHNTLKILPLLPRDRNLFTKNFRIHVKIEINFDDVFISGRQAKASYEGIVNLPRMALQLERGLVD